MARVVPLAGLALVVWLPAACATTMAQVPDEQSRREFLQRVDAALSSRDPAALSTLADVDRWKTAGRPALDQLKLWLPPAPLARTRDLTPNEVLYGDGDGQTWRLRLQRNDVRGTWTLLLPDRPCPPKSSPRVRPSDPRAGAEAPAPVPIEIWTVLECWPLPR